MRRTGTCMRMRVFLGLAQAVALWGVLAAQQRLKIVVIEGEGAVNIIQQRTAIAPVVEVRDRNDQPVAGALVSFTINGGRNAQFAGGLRTVSLTTNAAGRAAATAATPTGSGAVQINVAATFQGQTATATITQTNVATAAQASAASNVSSGGGSGGGPSTGTLVGIGAAAAGGLIATRRLTGASNQAPYLCGASTSLGAGLAAATVYMITVEGCDDDGAVVTYRWDFGDGTILTFDAGALATNRSTVTHVFQSPGTFNISVAFNDGEKDTTESLGTVTIASMTGQWALSGSNNIFLLSQSGAALGGSLGSPTGSGTVNGSIQPGNDTFGSVSSGGVVYASQSDTTVSLAATSVTGTGVVAGTFAGRQSPGLNSFTGTFTSATGTRTATITRQ